MGFCDEDRAQIGKMINDALAGAIPVIVAKCGNNGGGGGGRQYVETGSGEFAEDRTQINSLNNKALYDNTQSLFWRDQLRTTREEAQLFAHALDSLGENVSLQKKINATYFSDKERTARYEINKQVQSDRWQDDSAYVTRYDLSNPNTLATSDTLRGAVYPANRAIDQTSAALSNIGPMVESAVAKAMDQNTTFQDGVQAAVVNALNGTIPTLQAAIGAAIAAALVNTPTKPTA